MPNQILKDYLKKLRKSYHYNQEFVASALNISRQAYSHYETGRATPPNDVCSKIAELYKIPPNTLFSILCEEAPNSYISHTPVLEELTDYLDYISNEKNCLRFEHLTKQEKDLLYYFENISFKDQNEIIEFLKIKFNNQPKHR